MSRCRIVALLAALLVVSVFLAGCAAPVLVGGATATTYKAASDERTVGRVIDDTTLTIKINGRLMEEEDLPARKIDVDVIAGHVTLTGVVPTREQAARAEEVVRSVPGVKGVTNKLAVGISTLSQSMRDSMLATRIKARLLGTPEIRALNIDVDVNLGVVTLTGMVADDNQRRRVVEIAGAVPGVVRVDDNLTVRR